MTDLPDVPMHGNLPLTHYERAELVCPRSKIYRHGFLYALVFPGADHMQIGIGTASNYDLNRQHQPFTPIHYHCVMEAAAEIDAGLYRMIDGPLTRRFYGDDREPWVPGKDPEITNLILPNGAALAQVMRKMHRKVFGHPLKGATRIPLNFVIYETAPDFDLLVRHDAFLDRVVVGVTPKLDIVRAGVATWEFREVLRLGQIKAYHAAARWLQAGAISLPGLGNGYPDIQIAGDTLRQLSVAVVKHADKTWKAA